MKRSTTVDGASSLGREDVDQISAAIAQQRPRVAKLCCPCSGNCFEVALALHRIFDCDHDTQFYAIFTEPEHIEQSDPIPRHITLFVDGYLFDADGWVTEPQLLNQYLPWKETGREEHTRYDPTFQYDEIVDTDIVEELVEIYQPEIQRRIKY